MTTQTTAQPTTATPTAQPAKGGKASKKQTPQPQPTTGATQLSFDGSLAGVNTFGFLVFWTISKGVYDLGDLRHSATALGLSQPLIDKLTGADEQTAFKTATMLPTGGKQSAQSTPERKYRFVTKGVKDNTDPTRILALETVDASNVTLDVIQLGNMRLELGSLRYDSINRPTDLALGKELDALIGSIADDFRQRIGRVDDQKIRANILNWCKDRHHVTLRNTGGIYFLPSGGTANALAHEIKGIHDWFAQNGIGVFSSMELFPTPSTSVDDILTTAVTELLTDLEESEQKLKDHQDNKGMNAGSRMYSAGQHAQKLAQLLDKARALSDSLGEKVDFAISKIELTKARAERMFTTSAQQVGAERTERAQLAQQTAPTKKVGTVKQRKANSTL